MKKLLILALALMGLLIAVPAGATSLNEDVERTVPFASGGTIDIENFHGPITIHTWAEPKVKLMFVKSMEEANTRSSRDYLKASDVVMSVNGHTLKIFNKLPDKKTQHGEPTMFGNNHVTFEYELWIPAKSSLTVKTGKGKIQVEKLNGPLTVASTKGNIQLKEIFGNLKASSTKGYIKANTVKGNVNISSTEGDMSLNDVRGDVRASTSTGKCQYSNIYGELTAIATAGNQYLEEIHGKPTVKTTSGNIWFKNIYIPVDAKTDSGKISVVALETAAGKESTFNTTTGKVNLNQIKGNAVINTAAANANIKHITGDVRFKSEHGNLDVASLYGSVNAESKSGDICVTARTNSFKKPMYLKTDSGDIELRMPASVDADIALKTVSGEINTEFPIRPFREVSSYEAHGQLGNGGKKVSALTNSGDIDLDSI